MAGIDAGIILSAIQCIDFGNQAMRSDYHYQAVEWMETAVQKVKFERDTSTTLEKAAAGLETAKNMVVIIVFVAKTHSRFH